MVILSTETKTIHRQFVQMKYGSIYLFGVAAGNTSQNAIWDTVKIYGGLDKQRAGRVHFSCCLAYKDGNFLVYEQERPVRIRAFQVASPIWSIHLTCINLRHVNRTVPVGAAITIKPYTCNDSDVTYVQPYFPLRQTGTKIAIGTKTAYGNVSAESIIEWMEAYKHLGVDKVVSYYISTINTDALKVLQYYASTGILDLFYYEPAASGRVRYIKPGSKVEKKICSTHLIMNFIMFINVKMPTVVGILIFNSMINTSLDTLKIGSLFQHFIQMGS